MESALRIQSVGKGQQVVLIGAATVVKDQQALGIAFRRTLSLDQLAHAIGRVSTKTRPLSSITLANTSTVIRSGRQSRRSEMPAKKSTAAKKTVERM